MPVMIQVSDDKYNCIKHYIQASLEYVRMVEHKLTEVLEVIEKIDEE